MRTRINKQNGSIILMTALTILVLVAVVGLALDVGLSYLVKSKLNAATDAASIAAGEAVVVGATQSEQTANAKAAAKLFFNANYPANYLGSSVTLNDAVVTFNQGQITIDVTASATLPVSIMGVVNGGPLQPGVTSETVRKDTDMVLVMDNSGSLAGSGPDVKAAAITFLNQFNATRDRVGLLRFAYGSVVDDPISTTTPGFNRASMINHINGYTFAGSTASSEGMWQARTQLKSIIQNPSNMRVIVFFSDGAPNSFASYWPYKATGCTVPDTITTSDSTSVNTPGGAYAIDQMNTQLTGSCSPVKPADMSSLITGFPAWYNAHNTGATHDDPAQREFQLIVNSPRVVTNDVSTPTIAWTNVNRASRNLVEAMASKARDEGSFVFTLGLGSELQTGTGPDKEKGEDVLKCMANSVDSPTRCYNPAKPVGVYCYAATSADLTPCFSKLASAILRISK
jgi:Flp pilus assembly protein TadG